MLDRLFTCPQAQLSNSSNPYERVGEVVAFIGRGPSVTVTVRTSCPWMVWGAPTGSVPNVDPLNTVFLTYQTTSTTQVGVVEPLALTSGYSASGDYYTW